MNQRSRAKSYRCYFAAINTTALKLLSGLLSNFCDRVGDVLRQCPRSAGVPDVSAGAKRRNIKNERSRVSCEATPSQQTGFN
jgi:hypothetical protein